MYDGGAVADTYVGGFDIFSDLYELEDNSSRLVSVSFLTLVFKNAFLDFLDSNSHE